MQSFSQVAMLGQTAFRLAKSPVFVTHQTENRQQLGLRELMFAETATVGRQNTVRDFERHPSKRHQADFGHLHLLPHQKTPSTQSRLHSNSLSVPSMSTELHAVGNGATDFGKKDCHDRSDRVEERSEFRSPMN